MNAVFFLIRFIAFIILSVVTVPLTLLIIVVVALMLPALLVAVLIFLYYFLKYVLIVLAILFILLYAVGFVKAAFANKFEVFTSFFEKFWRLFQTSNPGVIERLKKFFDSIDEMMKDSAGFLGRYFRTGWAWVRAGGSWEI